MGEFQSPTAELPPAPDDDDGTFGDDGAYDLDPPAAAGSTALDVGGRRRAGQSGAPRAASPFPADSAAAQHVITANDLLRGSVAGVRPPAVPPPPAPTPSWNGMAATDAGQPGGSAAALREGIVRRSGTPAIPDDDGTTRPSPARQVQAARAIRDRHARQARAGTSPALSSDATSYLDRLAEGMARTTRPGPVVTDVAGAIRGGGDAGRAEARYLLGRLDDLAPAQARGLRNGLAESFAETPDLLLGAFPEHEAGETVSLTQGGVPKRATITIHQQTLTRIGKNGAHQAIADPFPASPQSAAFRNKLHELESAQDGYRAVNPVNNALGRYQMTEIALRDIGMKDANGRWTGKHGIHGDAGFLNDPAVQEKAAAEYHERNLRYLGRNGDLSSQGKVIQGVTAPITITESGLTAAAHRQGAQAVHRYLTHVFANGGRSDPTTFPPRQKDAFLSIETRLRQFQGIPLRP